MPKDKINLKVAVVNNLTEMLDLTKRSIDKFNQDVAYLTYRQNIAFSEILDIQEGR